MIKTRMVLVVLFLLGVLVSGCGQRTAAPGDNTQQAAKIKVLASVYPVYEFVRQVGGDKVEVDILVPAGAEPHEWEPSAKDLIQVKNAKLFFFHGANFEHWIGKVTGKDVLGSTTAVEVSKGIELKEGIPHSHGHDEHNHVDEHKHEHEHEENEIDPHVWLDPVLAQKEVDNIAEALAAADTANAAYYRENAANYNKELQKLHEEYQSGLQKVKKRTIITTHAAFGYLAERYQLEQVAIMGLSPDAEPTPEKMADITKLCRERQINYIFSETIVSSKVAETLAKEAGAKVLVLHPVDALTPDEVKQGKNYLTLMRANLANLIQALE
ncbi:metal ABC transporter solute-binding protein, Zn/Mn family [Sporomusa sphaeroides]|uniref:High-affinity zinc uptake system binding-protein ZnuA n=1 Tax=Sporomusa sphaeroides DSM 2875 TaxID=1337886 RepID=A0ABP2C647_9FIRM|nr:zinc ABC transporter substrate-binding protein [Sporomusa sphaeroides]OLS57983.1 high-affinity zinc uptake system binding-protein ZnuA precursor [Sporomusa sphaeroides DSM 2875]CVK17830.1 High-affinity zinc uptake system binding-protein ZnuA precursor [Sporomusa sphaeroides DSM 2875]